MVISGTNCPTSFSLFSQLGQIQTTCIKIKVQKAANIFSQLDGGRILAQVQAIGEKYRCNLCGNEVEVTAAGGGELRCCGQTMVLAGK
jgi:desulfoferrodoxin-like iron-binding protein